MCGRKRRRIEIIGAAGRGQKRKEKKYKKNSIVNQRKVGRNKVKEKVTEDEEEDRENRGRTSTSKKKRINRRKMAINLSTVNIERT